MANNFEYQPPVGPLSGDSFEKQTTDFFTNVATQTESAINAAQTEIAMQSAAIAEVRTVATTANEKADAVQSAVAVIGPKADEAYSTANTALSTALAANQTAVTAQDTANSKWTAVNASTSTRGIVQLNNALDSENETQAATPKAVSDALQAAREYTDGHTSPVFYVSLPAISGNDTVYTGVSYTYTLAADAAFNNASVASFDVTFNGTTQTVTATNGTATVTLAIPVDMTAGASSFTVQAEDTLGNKSPVATKAITVVQSYVNAPIIISPANASSYYTGTSLTVSLSAFSTTGASDTHLSSSYYITSDASGENVVASSVNNMIDLLSYTFSAADLASLVLGNTYYIWAVQTGTTLGASQKSESVSLSVIASFVNTPSIVSPVANSNVIISDGLTVTLSAFSTTGASDTQASASYKITSDAAGETVIAQSLNNTNDLTSHAFSAADVSSIVVGNTYYAWGKQAGTVLGSSAWSNSSAFNAIENMFLFTMYTSGSGINFFSAASTSRHPLSNYEVYINGNLTSQAYNSLTFSANDTIKIVAKSGVNEYPIFNASRKNYIKSVDAKFPCMFTSNGNTYEGSTNYNTGFFNECSSLEEIPLGLFDNNPQLKYLQGGFRNCTSLKSIPAHLLDPLTELSDCMLLFATLNNVSEIPVDLFKYNTEVTTMRGVFYGTNKITAIPENLFKYNTKVTNFYEAFISNNRLTAIPQNLFQYNTLANDFGYCFYKCLYVTGNLPTLWLSHPSASHGTCFTGCTQANNYAAAQSAGWA